MVRYEYISYFLVAKDITFEQILVLLGQQLDH